MKIIQSKILILVVGLFFFAACQKEPEVQPEVSVTNTKAVVGEKLKDPYSVENMRLAYATLKSQAKTTVELDIQATHYYVKFKPKNELELNILKTDSTLDLYPYPLDHEILNIDASYHDPSLPDEVPTYQYAAIPLNKLSELKVDFEIIKELYLPMEDEGAKSTLSTSLWETLEDESLQLTGNIKDEANAYLKKKKKWQPKGKIHIFDNSLNRWVGVEGVEVKARRWYTTRKGRTNADGFYWCDGKFRRNADYSLNRERHDFSIRTGTFGQAGLGNRNKEGDWNVVLQEGDQWFYATNYRAAYHYYYGDISNLGIGRPPSNGFLKAQVKIACYIKEGRGWHGSGLRRFGAFPRIGVYSKTTNTNGDVVNRRTDRIMTTMFHELCHAAHWKQRKGSWEKTTRRLSESWATAVGILMANDLGYNVYTKQNDTFKKIKEADDGIYTPIFIDMIDHHNQGGCCSKTRPRDLVSDYTLFQIEYALNFSKNLNEVKNEVKKVTSLPTERHLDDLFKQYIELKPLDE